MCVFTRMFLLVYTNATVVVKLLKCNKERGVAGVQLSSERVELRFSLPAPLIISAPRSHTLTPFPNITTQVSCVGHVILKGNLSKVTVHKNICSYIVQPDILFS